MKRLSILGSTGSVGVSTLDVVQRNPETLSVTALTANRQVDKLVEQCAEFRPTFAAIADETMAKSLADQLRPLGIEHGAGVEALRHAATLNDADAVMAAIVGGAGLEPTLAAAEAGKQVLLANKESLVMSGDLFMSACRQSGSVLLPIDSEHNAIFQCLPEQTRLGTRPKGVAKVILTASGGPFLRWPADRVANATPDEACAHPRWSMGRKISVDSATLMNKGLEIIEAKWLFDMPLNEIDVVIHPQSCVHSMVEFRDGSMLAQLGQPDMRIPIAHALAWPNRAASGVSGADLVKMGRLDFEAPDEDQFPALRLARQAAATGSAATIALNAANEIAVARFLAGKISFGQIVQLVGAIVDQTQGMAINSLEDVGEWDQACRRKAEQWA